MSTRNSTDKRTIIENYDLVSLAIDEIVDDGIILETDPISIASRVSKPPSAELGSQKLDLSEQGLYVILHIEVCEAGTNLWTRYNAWSIGSKMLANKLREGL